MRRAVKNGWHWLAMSLVVGLGLAACGADGGSADPTVAPATPTPNVTIAGVGDIVWTVEVDQATQAPVEALPALPNDAPQVIAALPVETLPAGTVLQAHWTIDGEPLPALKPDPVTVEDGLSDAWITWALRWSGDQPWPIGRLGIIVEIDGVDGPGADIPIVRPNQ